MKSEFRPASLLPALVLLGALFGCATDPPRGADPPDAAAAEGPSVEIVTRSEPAANIAEATDDILDAPGAAEEDSHAESAENAEPEFHAEAAEGAEEKAHAESAEVAEEKAEKPARASRKNDSLRKRYEEDFEEFLRDIVRSDWFRRWFKEHFDEFRSVLADIVDKAAGVAAPAAPAQPAAAPEIPWKTETYSLVARSMDLRQALETFGVAQGISTIMSSGVGGAISGEFADVPCGEFLDRLCSLHNLAWYWDGATLWIYAAGEMQTMLLDLRYMKAGEVRAMLAELGVEDPRFPLKTASNDELIMVSGPPRYVMLVAEMIQKADVLRERRTFNEIETRIFPLQNTWADDVSFNAGSPESSGSIKGVAGMLREIVGKIAAPGARAAGDTNAPASFSPLITAENRLNAVVVTDVAPRMPLYERLIRELDVPQKLVEIEVTVVDMSRNDALDLQLSIGGTLTKDRL